MKMMILSILTSVILLLCGCSKDPVPIEYGKDQCSHCRMTIVDKKYGSEIVTGKGKVYKFDAAECTVNFLIAGSISEIDAEMILVTDLAQPEKFTDARTATYLISSKLRSPMGENISAFTGRNAAEKFRNDFGGEIYDWNGIMQMLSSR